MQHEIEGRIVVVYGAVSGTATIVASGLLLDRVAAITDRLTRRPDTGPASATTSCGLWRAERAF